jgi:hypothetical protein
MIIDDTQVSNTECVSALCDSQDIWGINMSDADAITASVVLFVTSFALL